MQRAQLVVLATKSVQQNIIGCVVLLEGLTRNVNKLYLQFGPVFQEVRLFKIVLI